MAYSHSFSPEFYFQEGEPYDGGPEPSDRPTSVWHALESMRVLHPERWDAMARDVFGFPGRLVTEESVMDAIRLTDTVSNLATPVRVWIDPQGYYTIEVY